MSARMRKTHQFYVYEILNYEGDVIYIGKGSGYRMATSKRHRDGDSAREVARFLNEEDAYEYEIQRISEINPPLNKHKGGNGSRIGCIKGNKQDSDTKLMSKIGTKAFSAIMLLDFYFTYKYLMSKIDKKSNELKKAYTNDVILALENLDIKRLRKIANV